MDFISFFLPWHDHIYYPNLSRFLYSPSHKHFDCSLQIEPVQLILWFQIPQSNMGQLIQSTHGKKLIRNIFKYINNKFNHLCGSTSLPLLVTLSVLTFHLTWAGEKDLSRRPKKKANNQVMLAEKLPIKQFPFIRSIHKGWEVKLWGMRAETWAKEH